jgi:glucose/arabinose dehydrogenase
MSKNICIALFAYLFLLQNVLAAPPANFEKSTVASSLGPTTSMAFAPDGRLFITKQDGQIRIVKNGQLLPTPFLSLSVTSTNERGLLGLAFDPRFSSNRYIYLYYTSTGGSQVNRVVRVRARSDNPDLAEAGETILLQVGSAVGYHNGGAIHFGKDGFLYVAVGDAHNSNSNPALHNSQNLTNLLGKIVRIDVSSGSVAIPSDNPFANQAGARPEIYAYGFRNPFTFAVDSGSNKVYINDVGQDSTEEINLLSAGKNFGWPVCEGSCSNPSMTNPIFQYNHSNGCAITGGAFYRGSSFPSEYSGSYFYADYCGKWIRVLNSNNQSSVFDPSIGQIIDIDVSPDGQLYALDASGTVYRIRYTLAGSNNPPQARFSFSPTNPTPGTQVSFDGRTSSDADNDTLSFAWDFGNGQTGTGAQANTTFNTSGTFNVKLTVSDGKGGSNSLTTPVTVASANNGRPVARIISPDVSAKFSGGQTIRFSGDATDPEDGALVASRLTWQVDLLHHPENAANHHKHPVLPATSGVSSGSFEVSSEDHALDKDIWFRITLKARDSSGNETITTRDVFPNLAKLTISSNVTGIAFTLNGTPQKMPFSADAIVGALLKVSVTSPQTLANAQFSFTRWSNLQPASHSFKIEPNGVQLTASFEGVSTSPITPVPTTVATPVRTPSPGGRSPQVCGDFDGDKLTDISAIENGKVVVKLSRDQKVISFSNTSGKPVLGNFMSPDKASFGFVSYKDGVWSINVTDETSKTTKQATITAPDGLFVAGCDITGDARHEALVLTRDKMFWYDFATSSAGNKALSLATDVGFVSAACGNIQGGSKDEIVALTNSTQMFIYNNDGSITNTPGVRSGTSAVIVSSYGSSPQSLFGSIRSTRRRTTFTYYVPVERRGKLRFRKKRISVKNFKSFTFANVDADEMSEIIVVRDNVLSSQNIERSATSTPIDFAEFTSGSELISCSANVKSR